MAFQSDPHLHTLQFKGEVMDFELGLEVDHRKRRRNRTTQSCLNCHTSKRKCDRKRPCQRCIQLGLTGLCVYEVDDPSLRDDPNVDETTRLRNRIAELESLVRELRGKPHPKWAEPNYCDGDVNEKWHSRSAKRTQPPYQKTRRDMELGHYDDCVPPHVSHGVKTEQPPELPQQLYRLTASFGGGGTMPPENRLASSMYYRQHPQHSGHAGLSTSAEDPSVSYPSSSSSSPMGYEQQRFVDGSSHGDQYAHVHQSYTQISSHRTNTQSCSCSTNPAAANPLIGLTSQLRNTIQHLRQLPEHHHSEQDCLILARIFELDDILHGGEAGYVAESSYEALPTPAETEIMSPTSSSSQSSMGNTIHEWSTMAASAGYDNYFPVSSTEQGVYQKPYHMA
ncbi:uncharacterized protein FIBRA_01765 [Fibroporia radiculosa]|uniref:Zn(2)-C6 fungal-type domain-containing protein n=1 Tax=Fibroporia radiculosa TaxID=599839 RepID=J4G161_9APHY|nr:uncharacterized protein FIBRA_01765 [Fibroporia radiculosa]CCL99743.1 predicted protein [Fibroporia radiculosa]